MSNPSDEIARAAARLLTGAVALVPALLPAAGAVALVLAACLAP